MVNPNLQALLDLKDLYQISFPRMVMPDVEFSLTVYRVRIIAAGSGEDISNPKTFSYPPAVYATGFQRANAPGHPVFYAAADGKSALEEVRLNGEPLKVGDLVFLTKWQVKDEIKYSLNYLTRKNIIADHHGFKDLTLRIYSEFDRIFKNEDVFLNKEQRFLFEECTELFFSESYHASGTIGHDILYRTPVTNGIKISGIIYPSCANKFRGINFAFHPDFVDNALDLVSVQLATFKEFSEEGANLTSRYSGSVVDGKIVWTVQRLYLQINELTSQVFLEEDCDQEDVYDSIICLADGSKMKLSDYCIGQAELIDLHQHEMMARQEELTRIGKRFGYKIQNTFVNGTVKLLIGERLINVDCIEIVVPIDPIIEEISANEVLAKL
jgi:hypothetical protein